MKKVRNTFFKCFYLLGVFLTGNYYLFKINESGFNERSIILIHCNEVTIICSIFTLLVLGS